MNWKRLGRIVEANPNLEWSQQYAAIPTVRILNEDVLRVYYYSMDEDFNGRISYVDVSAHHPSEIIFRSEDVLLDIGTEGSFDDGGVCPLQFLQHENENWLYYLGVQRTTDVPYRYFAGVAKEQADGSFQRFQANPVLLPTKSEPDIRSAVSIFHDGEKMRMWYVGAFAWIDVNGKEVPTYRVHHAVSTDGLNWEVDQHDCIQFQNEDEFGFGRPWVLKKENGFEMFYSVRTKSLGYRLGYATSEDGYSWVRQDSELNFSVGSEPWENESVCYPCVVDVNGKRFLFYNGNQNGKTGFGVAVLEDKP